MQPLLTDLFELAYPWWQFILRAVAVYVVILLFVRLSGKRTVGQYTPFDMILVVLLGTAVQNSLIGEDVSLLGGLILAATLIGLNWLVGMLSARNQTLDRVFEGAPVLLARDGEVFHPLLRRYNITSSDFDEAMRTAGHTDRSEIALAVLEVNGRISVIGRKPDEASS